MELENYDHAVKMWISEALTKGQGFTPFPTLKRKGVALVVLIDFSFPVPKTYNHWNSKYSSSIMSCSICGVDDHFTLLCSKQFIKQCLFQGKSTWITILQGLLKSSLIKKSYSSLLSIIQDNFAFQTKVYKNDVP